ncbi:dienelactone hydrolase family protein [Maridesulfovibrio zosterae]|uniref:dienelactone hydrolase family protein n=1 Tax=Maridesulfovibrio zosterae TaxID=82171 RepID=UPI0004816D56|nr:dienelactone hydrolase family protein [Maridesulfovibrio zosterae]
MRKIQQTHREIDLEHIFILPEGDGPFPAVLLVHEYTGLNQIIIDHAKRLTDYGYAVLAVDFYGLNNRPCNIEEARTIHRIYRNNRLLMRERSKVCFDIIIKQPEIIPSMIFAFGLSFGGGAVLELARSGVDLKGAISVYGYLDTSHPVGVGDIKCPLLAFHVEDDPVVPSEHATAFEVEMDSAGVEWEMVKIKNSCHGFANPQDGSYDQLQAEKMWDMVQRKLISWSINKK